MKNILMSILNLLKDGFKNSIKIVIIVGDNNNVQ